MLRRPEGAAGGPHPRGVPDGPHAAHPAAALGGLVHRRPAGRRLLPRPRQPGPGDRHADHGGPADPGRAGHAPGADAVGEGRPAAADAGPEDRSWTGSWPSSARRSCARPRSRRRRRASSRSSAPAGRRSRRTQPPSRRPWRPTPRRSASSPPTSPPCSSSSTNSGNIPSVFNGTLIWPVSGVITQEFGCTGFRSEPPHRQLRPFPPGHRHRGADVHADPRGRATAWWSSRARTPTIRIPRPGS